MADWVREPFLKLDATVQLSALMNSSPNLSITFRDSLRRRTPSVQLCWSCNEVPGGAALFALCVIHAGLGSRAFPIFTPLTHIKSSSHTVAGSCWRNFSNVYHWCSHAVLCARITNLDSVTQSFAKQMSLSVCGSCPRPVEFGLRPWQVAVTPVSASLAGELTCICKYIISMF